MTRMDAKIQLREIIGVNSRDSLTTLLTRIFSATDLHRSNTDGFICGQENFRALMQRHCKIWAVTLTTFLEEIEQKETHLCRGSGAAGGDNEDLVV